MAPQKDFVLDLLHAKGEEAIDSVKLASQHFTQLLDAVNLIGPVLKKAEDSSTALVDALAHETEQGQDGVMAKLDVYHKLVQDLGLAESACHDAASKLFKFMAALQTSESFDGPASDLFVKSVSRIIITLLFSIFH